MLNVKSSVLLVYMIYIWFTQRRAAIQHIFSILYKDVSETCWQGLTERPPRAALGTLPLSNAALRKSIHGLI